MTTITSVEQLDGLASGVVIRERGGCVLQKDGDGWETTYGSFVDHEGVQLPATVLAPLSVTAEQVEKAARACMVALGCKQWTDTPECMWCGEGCGGHPEITCCDTHDEDSPAVGEPCPTAVKAARAALTALGFEVVD